MRPARLHHAKRPVTAKPEDLFRPNNGVILSPGRRENHSDMHRHPHAIALTAGLLFGLIVSAHSAASDPRTTLPRHTASWQRALAHISVPTSRLADGRMKHYTEHCTAVAVTPGPEPLFLSAWHCFEHYRSTVHPITVMSDQAPTTTTLRLIDSGGSMKEDWALLQANQAFSNAAWIPVSPAPASTGQSVTAAGFAPLEEPAEADNAPRQLKAHLTCAVIDAVAHPHASDCTARQGASGGAIIGWTESGSAQLLGIISAGDGETVSYFYPATLLIDRIQKLR